MKTRTPIAAPAVLDLATLDRVSGGCRRVVVQREPTSEPTHVLAGVDGWSLLASLGGNSLSELPDERGKQEEPAPFELHCGTITRSAS